MQDADRIEQLVCGVAHDNFGLLLDMGNFLCADESPAVAIGKLRAVCLPCARQRLLCA